MSEQLNRQCLFEMAQLLASLFGSLHLQEKVHIFTILDWIDRLEAFDSNALAAWATKHWQRKQIFENAEDIFV